MCPCLAVTTPLSPAPVCTFIFTHHLSHLDKQEKSYHLPLALCCSSVKRCCVTSSWWQAAWRCRLTGWSWRPVALTSVPCSQVHTHTRTVVCLASYLDVCVCWRVLNCVCLQVIWARARPIRWRSERWTDRLWENWWTTSTRLRSRSRRTTYRWERPVC